MQPIGAHCCTVMYFGYFGFRGEFGFMNCDDMFATTRSVFKSVKVSVVEIAKCTN